MTQLAYINGATLKVVREDKGVSLEFLAKKARIAPSVIALWESGAHDNYPTMRQAEALAKVLQVPLAGLYTVPGNYPKGSRPITVNMRRLFDASSTDDSSVNLAIDQLCGLRQQLLEFRAELGKPLQATGVTTLSPDPVVAADFIRDTLNITVEEQKSLGTSRKLFKLIRRKLEERGILLLEFTGVDTVDCRGLSLFFNDYAVAGVNEKDRWPGKCFSAIHELGHLSMRSSAICNDMESGDSRSEEVYCNALAGNFLVPMDDLRRELGKQDPISLDVVACLAKTFCVSKEVVVRRLLDLGYVSRFAYEQITAELEQQLEEDKRRAKEDETKGRFALNPAQRSVDRRGTVYVEAVQGCLVSGAMNEFDAASYLGVSTNRLDGVFREALL